LDSVLISVESVGINVAASLVRFGGLLAGDRGRTGDPPTAEADPLRQSPRERKDGQSRPEDVSDDVILDLHGSELRSPAIVDYKTSADPAVQPVLGLGPGQAVEQQAMSFRETVRPPTACVVPIAVTPGTQHDRGLGRGPGDAIKRVQVAVGERGPVIRGMQRPGEHRRQGRFPLMNLPPPGRPAEVDGQRDPRGLDRVAGEA
jgi:hypothetical protein